MCVEVLDDLEPKFASLPSTRFEPYVICSGYWSSPSSCQPILLSEKEIRMASKILEMTSSIRRVLIGNRDIHGIYMDSVESMLNTIEQCAIASDNKKSVAVSLKDSRTKLKEYLELTASPEHVVTSPTSPPIEIIKVVNEGTQNPLAPVEEEKKKAPRKRQSKKKKEEGQEVEAKKKKRAELKPLMFDKPTHAAFSNPEPQAESFKVEPEPLSEKDMQEMLSYLDNSFVPQ